MSHELPIQTLGESTAPIRVAMLDWQLHDLQNALALAGISQAKHSEHQHTAFEVQKLSGESEADPSKLERQTMQGQRLR